jgi:hypothetical protein
MFKIRLNWCFVLAILVTLSTNIVFAGIAVNFPAGTSVTASVGAPGCEQANWLNTVNQADSSGTTYTLTDDLGNIPGAVLSYWASGFGTQIGFSTTPAAAAMLERGIGTDNSSDPATFTVTKIPYAEYSVVIYFGSRHDFDYVQKVTANGVSLYGRVPVNTGYAEMGYRQIPDTSTSDLGAETPYGNYMIFEGMTDSNLTVSAVPGWSSTTSPRAYISGFQIIPTKVSDAIIGPALSPAGVNFNVDGTIQWYEPVSSSNLDITDEGANIALIWKGSTSATTIEARSNQKLSINRGYNDEVRIIFELSLTNDEFGASVTPAVVEYDASNNVVARINLNQQWYPTQSGHTRTISMQWNPASTVAKVSPALLFNGNAVECRVMSVRLDPAQAQLTWESGVNVRTPPVRYKIDNAQPVEDTAVLTTAQLDRKFITRARAYPKVVETNDPYKVELRVNGVLVNPAVHMSASAGYTSAHFGDMYKAGVNIATVTVKAGPSTDTPGAPANIWLGANSYDFEPLRQAIRYAIARAPNSYIMLNLFVNVYNNWGIEHPNDVHANEAGEKAVACGGRVVRYGGDAPGYMECWEASNHSAQFRTDGSNFLYALGQWLASAAEGKVVIGAYINGSTDGQWLYSSDNSTGQVEFACFSVGALNAFRDYLREKYVADAALSAAWGFDVTFDTAQMPSYAVRSASAISGSPLMSYNGTNSQGADYNKFLSVSNTRRQIAFCTALKQGSSGRLLCGSYWPTLPASYPLTHTDFHSMLADPNIDFISRGGLLGGAYHGKLTIDELDLRSPMSGFETWQSYDLDFIPKSQGEYKRQMDGMVLRAITSGGGYHLYDMWGGWFWHPEAMQIVKDAVTKIVANAKEAPSLGSDYVGVFVDEDAGDYCGRVGRYYMLSAVENTAQAMGWGYSSAWSRAGVPVKFFLMQDALDPNLTLPKVAIFLNPLRMDLAMADNIKTRFCNNGRVVVYMLAPGLAAAGTSSNPSTITGFNITEEASTRNKPLVIKAGVSDNLLTGIRAGSSLCYWREESGYYNNFVSSSANGKVLGVYGDSSSAGLMVERRTSPANHTVVWIGFPGALSPQFIRNLAKEAGMTPMLESDNEILIGSGLLGIIGIAGGTQTVHLPANYKIEKCLSGHDYTVENGILTFDLGYGDYYGDVAVFSISQQQAINGNVELLNYDSSKLAGTEVQFEIRQNGTLIDSQVAKLDSQGNFSIGTSAQGTVEIWAKASHWLAQKQTAQSPGTVNFSLINGDVNGDNIINFLDFAGLAEHWLEQNN